MTNTARFSDGGGWEKAAGYSRGARFGDHIAISGTTAHAPDGVMFVGDLYGQTKECLLRAIRAVEALDGSKSSIIRTRLFLAPGVDWEQAGRAHQEIMGEVAPANTTLFVHSFVGPDFLVEVEVEAVALS